MRFNIILKSTSNSANSLLPWASPDTILCYVFHRPHLSLPFNNIIYSILYYLTTPSVGTLHYKKEKKCQSVSTQATKACGGVQVKLHSLSIPLLEGGEWLALRHGRLTP
jgi:hypothetical protein